MNLITNGFCRQLTLAVGTGRNCFHMSRGSFRYRKIDIWRRLRKIDDPKATDEGTMAFRDIQNGDLYYVDSGLSDDGQSLVLSVRADLNNHIRVDRFRLTIPCGRDEHFYGCGETHSEFDLKGKRVRIWVAEHQNTQRIAGKILRQKVHGKDPQRVLHFRYYESYHAQPTFVSSAGYFVHGALNRYGEFDFTESGRISFYTQELPHFIIQCADTFAELSEKLTSLLGRQRRLPDWIYDGGILAVQDWTVTKAGTVSAEDGIACIDRKIKKARDAGAKICGVWSQDWCGCRCTKFGYQVMWNWEYDPRKYPELPAAIRRWKQEGIHFLGYVNPFLALEKELYAEAHEKGYCVKDKKGRDYLVTITTFPAAMVDLTNPEAYSWYKDLIKKNMIGIGMSGWMADFGEYLPVDSVLAGTEDPAAIHNHWPAIWAQLNREAIEECGVQDEVFFFTRAGCTGTPAASDMMWTGDQHVDWSEDDGLISAVPATLSLAMSGFGITHSDVGGYTTVMEMVRSKELLMRWIEMNAFSPLFRCHEGNQPSRNVQFDRDDETLRHTAYFTSLHAALKEYLKDCVEQTVSRGIPVMRPMFYHYDEPACYTEKTQYLLGRDILCAPVYRENARSRIVYLPKDNWLHLFTGEEYASSGAEYTIRAPLGCPPVLIRKTSPYAAKLTETAALLRECLLRK